MIAVIIKKVNLVLNLTINFVQVIVENLHLIEALNLVGKNVDEIKENAWSKFRIEQQQQKIIKATVSLQKNRIRKLRIKLQRKLFFTEFFSYS